MVSSAPEQRGNQCAGDRRQHHDHDEREGVVAHEVVDLRVVGVAIASLFLVAIAVNRLARAQLDRALRYALDIVY
jgi:hypothetical protein